MATPEINQLSLTPLGPGDLIDRAIRLYRRHFATLLWIAAPPTLLTAVGAVLLSVGMREAQLTTGNVSLALYATLWIGGLLLWLLGLLLYLIVMGGASRNLVTHILWGEAVSARTTYRNAKARFAGLLGASLIVLIGLLLAGFVSIIILYLGVIVVVVAAIAAWQVSPFLAIIIGIISSVFFFLLACAIFFFLAGKVAYVPQVMLIEGKSVGEALSRSITLGKGNFKRLMALCLFTLSATYSALMILIIPLGWYGYLNGIDPSPWNTADWPVWYSIGYTVVSQASGILLTPVWMLGLSLMYIDERVRQEGYDLELLAARQLPVMPELPPDAARYYNPAVVAAGQKAAP
jgi:hypothetical protein